MQFSTHLVAWNPPRIWIRIWNLSFTGRLTSTRILKTPLSQNIGRAYWSSCFRIFKRFNIDVYVAEYYSFMGLGMNGRKPTYISVTLDEDSNDVTHTHDGMMCVSSSVWCKELLWKQLSSNSVVDELSAIWGFTYLVGFASYLVAVRTNQNGAL